MLEVYAVGSTVRLADGAADEGPLAMITAVTITADGPACYEVVWYSGATRNCVWVKPCEIVPHEGSVRRRVGFIREHSRGSP